MGEGGIKNGQKNSDVFYGRPLSQMFGLCDLPNANFGLFISLVRFFGYFCPKNRSNEINRHKIALAKYNNRSDEINSSKNT